MFAISYLKRDIQEKKTVLLWGNLLFLKENIHLFMVSKHSLYRLGFLSATALFIGLSSGLSPATAIPQKTAGLQQNQAVPVQNAELDFTLVNKTGYSLSGLYLSPSSADDWGDNILEVVLDSDESVDIMFSPHAKAVKWDLRADWLMEEDAEEQEFVYWQGLSLDEISQLTLYYNAETGKTSAKAE